MSIKNLEYTGSKNQDITCRDLTVTRDANINNIEITDLYIPNGGSLTSDGTNLFNKDITISSGDVNVSNGDINVSGGDINNPDNNVYASEIILGTSISNNSNGPILWRKGTMSWGPSEGPGTPKSITLNGNAHVGYILKFQYNLYANGSNVKVTGRFDSDSSNVYNYQRRENNSGNTQAFDSGSFFYLIDNTFNNPVYGLGELTFYTSGNIPQEQVPIMGDHMMQRITFAGNNPQKNTISASYNRSVTTNITSINFDVDSANHTGINIYYRIYRLQ